MWALVLGALASCGRLGYQPVDPDAAVEPVEAGPLDGGGSGPPDTLVDAAAPDATGAPVDSSAAIDVRPMDGLTEAPGTADAPDAAEIGLPPPDAPAAPPAHCQTIPRLPAPPTIDGELEPGLSLERLPSTHWLGDGALPPGHVADLAVGWRPAGLYFYLRVRDLERVAPAPGAQLWCGDGVELYVDDDARYAIPGSFDNPGSRQFAIAAPANDTDPVARGETYRYDREGAWASQQFRAYPRPDGYVVEALITAGDLGLGQWFLAENAQIGMNVAVNVATTSMSTNPRCPQRLGQYLLNVFADPAADAPPDYPYRNTRAFCSPRLLP